VAKKTCRHFLPGAVPVKPAPGSRPGRALQASQHPRWRRRKSRTCSANPSAIHGTTKDHEMGSDSAAFLNDFEWNFADVNHEQLKP
jgi:hypothetical protein